MGSPTVTNIAFPIDQSKLTSLVIASDVDVTVVAKTGGSGGTPVNIYGSASITLRANHAIHWQDGDAAPCPIAADIDTLVVTNSDTDHDANVDGRALLDA